MYTRLWLWCPCSGSVSISHMFKRFHACTWAPTGVWSTRELNGAHWCACSDHVAAFLGGRAGALFCETSRCALACMAFQRCRVSLGSISRPLNARAGAQHALHMNVVMML